MRGLLWLRRDARAYAQDLPLYWMYHFMRPHSYEYMQRRNYMHQVRVAHPSFTARLCYR